MTNAIHPAPVEFSQRGQSVAAYLKEQSNA